MPHIGITTDARDDVRDNIAMFVGHGGQFNAQVLDEITGPSTSCQDHIVGENL